MVTRPRGLPRPTSSSQPQGNDVRFPTTRLCAFIQYSLYVDYGIPFTTDAHLDKDLRIYDSLCAPPGTFRTLPGSPDGVFDLYITDPCFQFGIDDEAVVERIRHHSHSKVSGPRSMVAALIQKRDWETLAMKMYWDEYVGIPLAVSGADTRVIKALREIKEVVFEYLNSPLDFEVRAWGDSSDV